MKGPCPLLVNGERARESLVRNAYAGVEQDLGETPRSHVLQPPTDRQATARERFLRVREHAIRNDCRQRDGVVAPRGQRGLGRSPPREGRHAFDANFVVEPSQLERLDAGIGEDECDIDYRRLVGPLPDRC